MKDLPTERKSGARIGKPKPPVTLLDLYQTEKEALFSYLCGLLRDANLAEDFLQDVFMALLKKDIPKTDFNLKAYLYISARNRVVDHFRRSKIHQTVFTAYRAYRDLEIPSGADKVMMKEEEGDYLRRQITRLKPEQQEIIYLHLSGNMTFAEIAQVLHQPQGTVASRYLRGIEKLKEFLRGSDYDVQRPY